MISPETPSRAELDEIAATVAEPSEKATVEELLENAAIAKFSGYITDGPGYSGPVYVIVWPGGPEIVDVLTRDRAGKLVANRPPEPLESRESWGEDDEFPRADWRYEVQNNTTNLGYWEWVASSREARRG